MTVAQLLGTLSDDNILVRIQDLNTEKQLWNGQVYELAEDGLIYSTVKAWVPIYGGDYIELLISI